MSRPDGFDLDAGVVHYFEAVVQSKDDAFLRCPQQVRPVMNIEIQAVNRSPYIAILKCPLGTVAEGKYRKTIRTHRGLCGKLIHLVVVHRAGIVF